MSEGRRMTLWSSFRRQREIASRTRDEMRRDPSLSQLSFIWFYTKFLLLKGVIGEVEYLRLHSPCSPLDECSSDHCFQYIECTHESNDSRSSELEEYERAD